MICGDLVISFLIWTINFWINSPIEIHANRFGQFPFILNIPKDPMGLKGGDGKSESCCLSENHL